MASRRSREAAYADLVAGLLDVRPDPATDRFDAELAAAEAEGRIDPQTARVLRWWQRETLRALVDHARTVVPPTMLALELSAAGAGPEAEASAQSWARAVGDDLSAHTSPRPRPPDPPVQTGAAATAPEERAAAGPTDVPPPTDLAEHRRRLLVAGLTRVQRQP